MDATRSTDRDATADTAASMSPLAIRVSALYLALYAHYGFIAFMPLWLKGTGATPAEIGLLMAIPLILRLVTVAPFSAWAGRRGRVRDAIGATALASAAIIPWLLAAPAHGALIALFILFAIVWDQTPVLTDAYAVMAVRARGIDFGRVRVWGSIAVVLSNAAAGAAIAITGIGALPIMIAALLLLPVGVAMLLPADRSLVPPERSAEAGGWRELFGDRGLLLAMVAVSMIVGSHGVLTSFGAIQWSAQGISTGTIGLLQALAVSAEIAAFWFGATLLGQRDPRWLIVIAGTAAVARWALMATAPAPTLLIAAQLLNGLTASGAILGIMLLIARRVPGRLSAAAQGLNAVLMGAVLAVATAGSGLLWSIGLPVAYAAMAGLGGLAAILAWPRVRERRAIA